MRSRRSVIHVGLTNWPMINSLFYQFNGFSCRRNVLFSHFLKVYSFPLFFPDFDVIFCNVKQVFYFFHVYFNHWDFYSEFDESRNFLYFIEYLVNHSRQKTLNLWVHAIRTNACMSFSRRCLSIRKNSPVKPFKCWINDVSSHFFVNLLLGTVHSKNLIKWKSMVRLFVVHFNVHFVEIYTRSASAFLKVEWPNPNENFHRVAWTCFHEWS